MTTRIRRYWLYFAFFYYFAFFPLLNWVSYGGLDHFLFGLSHSSFSIFLLGNFSSLLLGSAIPFFLAYYFGYKKMGSRYLSFICYRQVIKLIIILIISFSLDAQETVTFLFLGEFAWLYLSSSLRRFNIEWKEKEHVIPASLLHILTAMDRASSYDELSRHYHYAIDLWPHYFQQIHRHFSKIRDRVAS